MKAFKSGIIGLMILAGTAVSAFAGQERLEGGHDGGGAGVQLSSEAEVRDAIKWAFEDLRKEDSKGNPRPSWLFWAYGGPEMKRYDGDMVAITLCMKMPTICENLEQLIESDSPIYSNTWAFLKLSPVEIKGQGQGACPAPDKKDAAASVSEYKIGAKICFSVDMLKKTPRDVLRAQVASILAHEMAHLLGYGEEIAEGVQGAVYSSFSRTAMEEIQRMRDSVMSQFFHARFELKQVADGVLCSNLACNNADLKVMWILGSFHGRIQTMLSIMPVGLVKEPSMAAKQEIWEKAHNALKAPWNRMYTLQMDITEGKSSMEQQREQARLAIQELDEAEKIVSEFLGSDILR